MLSLINKFFNNNCLVNKVLLTIVQIKGFSLDLSLLTMGLSLNLSPFQIKWAGAWAWAWQNLRGLSLCLSSFYRAWPNPAAIVISTTKVNMIFSISYKFLTIWKIDDSDDSDECETFMQQEGNSVYKNTHISD